ncbi:MAG: hypothetical protein IT565_14265, partial [Rhodospirillales bacterium]|nr:hypothetical protein [Rhodospirillales bacterium]
MTRWNISHILLYSHDDRRREVELRIGQVNIITGDSSTGKSGLAEVIDYVMGSSECHIPGVIRDATSWVGLLWVNDETQCLLCRKIPHEEGKSSTEYHLSVGRGVSIPSGASGIGGKTTRNAALAKFEQLLGIGAVESETFGAGQRTGARISVRHT